MKLTRTLLVAVVAFELRQHGFIGEAGFDVGLGIAYFAGGW